jgi:hypothetical protein
MDKWDETVFDVDSEDEEVRGGLGKPTVCS